MSGVFVLLMSGFYWDISSEIVIFYVFWSMIPFAFAGVWGLGGREYTARLTLFFYGIVLTGTVLRIKAFTESAPYISQDVLTVLDQTLLSGSEYALLFGVPLVVFLSFGYFGIKTVTQSILDIFQSY